jgi:hypothetical protein
MSRNFELMEQVERQRSFRPQQCPEPEPTASDRLRERHDKAEWASNDALGLMISPPLPMFSRCL